VLYCLGKIGPQQNGFLQLRRGLFHFILFGVYLGAKMERMSRIGHMSQHPDDAIEVLGGGPEIDAVDQNQADVHSRLRKSGSSATAFSNAQRADLTS
jgi:hypothetical protein